MIFRTQGLSVFLSLCLYSSPSSASALAPTLVILWSQDGHQSSTRVRRTQNHLAKEEGATSYTLLLIWEKTPCWKSLVSHPPGFLHSTLATNGPCVFALAAEAAGKVRIWHFGPVQTDTCSGSKEEGSQASPLGRQPQVPDAPCDGETSIISLRFRFLVLPLELFSKVKY